MRILVNDYAGHPFQLQLSRELALLGHTLMHTYFADAQGPKGKLESPSDAGIGLRIVGIHIDQEFAHYSTLSRRSADRAYGRKLAAQIARFTPDMVISANTPLDAQRMILSATHKQGAKFIFWVQDLLSQAIEFVLRKKGVPLAGLAGRYYARLERQMLKRSDAIICIAPEFRERLVKWGISTEVISVIENWSPLDEMPSLPRDTVFRREHGLQGKFCFMYSGTLGMKHRPELLWALSQHFRDWADVVTVVIAQGAGADWLREKANTSPNPSLIILPFQPYQRHAEVLASANVLVTLLDSECGSFAVPSKLLAYLCAGRAQLVAAPVENLASRIIDRARAGVAIAAEGKAFLRAAAQMVSQPEQLEELGANARTYAEKTFCIERISAELLRVIAFALVGRKQAQLIKFPLQWRPKQARAGQLGG